MRKLFFSSLFLLQVLFVSGQGKILVPEEIMSDRSLYPSGLNNIQWQGNSDYFTWQVGHVILRGHVKKGLIDTLYNLKSFNQLFTATGKEALKRMPFITWKDENIIAFSIGSDYYELKNGGISVMHSLPQEAENIEIAPKTGYLAFTIQNNLLISNGGQILPVTDDSDKGIVNGQSVHRNEFGIEKGFFWSPEGNKLAFYKMDETMVTEYPLVDITARVAEINNIKYPMAGMTSHNVNVGIYDVNTGRTIFLKTGEPKEQYLTNIAWSPDQNSIYIAVINRDQNHMKLNQYDAITGEFIKTLFEEKNDRYVEPQNPIVFLPKKPDHFIWQSQRDGFNHLYLYNVDGKLVNQLTSGAWVVTGFYGFDANGNGVFFTSNEPSPVGNYLYYIDLRTCKRGLLTSEKGTHNITIRPDGYYFITSYSNISTPRVVKIQESRGKYSRELKKAENPLSDYELGKTDIFTIKAADGTTDLYCRLIKPANFDPQKKYPVFIYVYGGPHAQLVTDTWMSGGLFLQYMAQKGYIVFTLDNRGSANRGFEFESIIHRHVGEVEMADQMKGVEYLKSLPYVDVERIGVDGWSYGGFMSVNLKLTHPEVFKVATAGGPVTDWKYYEVMYGERYMDTPEQNPDGYKNSSLINKAGNLDGKLLIIHGGMDPTVVWQQSLDFVKACIDNKKQLDYFVYPTHEHNVGGIDRAHLFRKIASYFDENLVN
jgi:dipeptidyl-peptidase-4